MHFFVMHQSICANKTQQLALAHARVPAQCCADLVAVGADCCAVGNDQRARAAVHEIQPQADGSCATEVKVMRGEGRGQAAAAAAAAA